MHWIALPLPGGCGPSAASAASAATAASAASAAESGRLDPAATAWWALRFTPRVALVDGEAVLLEVSTTERLWGGRQALHAQVLEGWATTCAAQEAGAGGVSTATPPLPACGCGATALAAQARLRMALAAPPGGAVRREPLLEHLPLHTLTALRPHVAALERMGCRTWGALRALPRAGVARRIGAAALRVLDQAWGDAPEALRWVELPEQFVLSAELPALAETADALLWSAHRGLAALQSWLQARQQGALALELAWRHDLRRVDGVAIAPTQALTVRTAQPTQDMPHLRRLLAENLARTPLAAPANHITLRLVESDPLPHRTASLLPPADRPGAGPPPAGGATAEPGEALHQLLERLAARLGADQVQAPVLQADHRPERMQQWRPAPRVLDAAAAPTVPAGPHAPDGTLWPTWLLPVPRRLAVQGSRPCHHGLLRLLAGPHRFEAGWWSAPQEGADRTSGPAHARHPGQGLALRDYFVAYNDAAGLVWIFRERLPAPAGQDTTTAPATVPTPPRWFLHGFFG
ncbi:DNA polymerase Y family protein [Paracidovorax sp. MALMAid1276]|uniref:DNA polymerase Y family protein n=1 Tax=Paracidovorax sp. MALMAid1276 TaxID=3411631 RepID=UPI003B9C4487